MSKKTKILLFGGLAVVVAIMVVFNLKKARGDVIEVQTDTVKRGDITQTVTGSGKIQPEKEVKISAFVSAEIVRLHVEEGDQVTVGQLLVELDKKRYEAALERAKSDLKSARAELKKSRSELQRAKELFAKKLFSEADLEGAEANYELAESRVDQAQALLKQAQDDLSKTRLLSPIAGTVSKLNKEEGEIALGSQFQADVIMTVADLTRMEMEADIDENDVVLVSLGDSADVEVDALPDRVFHGVVSEIAHTATTRGLGTQEEVTNFKVKIRIVDDVSQLRPGMSATVDIKTETHKNVLYVPIQSITTREADSTFTVGKLSSKTWRKKRGSSNDANAVLWGGDRRSEGEEKTDGKEEKKEKMMQVVFVVRDGKAYMTPVDTGISSDRDVEVVYGVEEGDEIVTGSYRALSTLLKNESRVKINNKVRKFKRKET